MHRLSGRDRVAFLSGFARQAVALSAQTSGLALPALEQDVGGRPMPSGNIFWSLSHKPGCVAGVAAETPVGIDVEEIRPVAPGLVEKILDSRERGLFNAVGPEFFFRAWTAKEAVLKLMGVGLKGLSQCRVKALSGPSALKIRFDDREFHVQQTRIGSHIISVTAGNRKIFWTLPAPEETWPSPSPIDDGIQ